MSERRTIRDEIGLCGLIATVWTATPLPWKLTLVAIPYNMYAYGQILQESTTRSEVHLAHSARYQNRPLFRLVRPLHRRVTERLRDVYNIS
jgi:hypothetical protein